MFEISGADMSDAELSAAHSDTAHSGIAHSDTAYSGIAHSDTNSQSASPLVISDLAAFRDNRESSDYVVLKGDNVVEYDMDVLSSLVLTARRESLDLIIFNLGDATKDGAIRQFDPERSVVPVTTRISHVKNYYGVFSGKTLFASMQAKDDLTPDPSCMLVSSQVFNRLIESSSIETITNDDLSRPGFRISLGTRIAWFSSLARLVDDKTGTAIPFDNLASLTPNKSEDQIKAVGFMIKLMDDFNSMILMLERDGSLFDLHFRGAVLSCWADIFDDSTCALPDKAAIDEAFLEFYERGASVFGDSIDLGFDQKMIPTALVYADIFKHMVSMGRYNRDIEWRKWLLWDTRNRLEELQAQSSASADIGGSTKGGIGGIIRAGARAGIRSSLKSVSKKIAHRLSFAKDSEQKDSSSSATAASTTSPALDTGIAVAGANDGRVNNGHPSDGRVNDGYASDGRVNDGRELRLIGAITSFPPRIDVVEKSIESIFKQTMPLDGIVLQLAISQFPNKEDDLPKSLLDLCDRGLSIGWCNRDTGSHKRYLNTIQDNPDAAVIMFDDDIIYDEDTVEVLYKAHLKHPNAVIGVRAHRITFEEDGSPSSYSLWENSCDDYLDVERMDLFATSGAGTLLPPNCLPAEAFDEDLIMELAPTADDIWFKFMELITNTPVVVARKYTGLNLIEKSQDASTLYGLNRLSNGNDAVIQRLFDRFNLYHGPEDTLMSRLARDQRP